MEEWKDIPGYEHLYQASTHGRIRTCEGKTTQNARYERRVWKQRIIKQKFKMRHGGKNTDARVCLWKDGKEHTLLVARLVAMTWCAGYKEGLTVNHIDGNSLNNHFTNLEWVSLARNIQMAFENGVSNQKAVALISPSGETMRFKSMAQAGQFLGHCGGYISGCLKRGKHATPCGYRIEVEAG